MSDGTCCHYCNRYTCICDQVDKAEIVEPPRGAMIWAVFLPDAAMPFTVIMGRDAAMAFYKANESAFGRGYYRLRRIEVDTGLSHDKTKIMLAGLLYAHHVFEQYAALHKAKGNAEKAERNQSHADAIADVVIKSMASLDGAGERGETR